jgi:hypothetical protein
MAGTDCRHLDEFPVDQFDTHIGREEAEFAHTVEIGDAEAHATSTEVRCPRLRHRLDGRRPPLRHWPHRVSAWHDVRAARFANGHEGTGRRMPMRFAGKVNAPEFPAGTDWLNADRPLSLAALRGRLVLLDFWTFG